MSAQHTPGRMTWERRPDGSLYYVIGNHTTGPHAQGDIYIDEADLHRIAACWNACVEFSTEALEDDAPIKLREDRDQLLVQLEHSRARFDQLVQILVGVHALLYPPVMTLDDGRTFVFRPTDPDPHQLLQALSDRIRAIPDEIAKATGSTS